MAKTATERKAASRAATPAHIVRLDVQIDAQAKADLNWLAETRYSSVAAALESLIQQEIDARARDYEQFQIDCEKLRGQFPVWGDGFKRSGMEMPPARLEIDRDEPRIFSYFKPYFIE